MGQVMGASMDGWMALYGLLGLILLGVAAFIAASAVRRRSLPPTGPGPSIGARPADEAQAALRRRYAAGEISREDYLQAKVELED